jgi:hypothetical protein
MYEVPVERKLTLRDFLPTLASKNSYKRFNGQGLFNFDLCGFSLRPVENEELG